MQELTEKPLSGYQKRAVEGKKEAQPQFNLATLWHFYQPPNQTEEWVRIISEECYRPFSRWLAENDFCITVNINHSLVNHLQRLHLDDVIENLGRAAQKGNVEFTGSGAYHPILPDLLSYKGGESEIKRQIELNEKRNRQVFGDVWEPKGFFPPEMAFSPELASIIRQMGYEWAATDATLFDATNPRTQIPHKEIGCVDGLPVFFRSNAWSNEFSLDMPKRGDYNIEGYIARMQTENSSWFSAQSGYIVVAYDAETLGHHVKQYDTSALDRYSEECNRRGIKPVLLSDLLKSFSTTDVEILPGSWGSSIGDIKAGEYFPLWSHSKNPVHQLLRKLTEYAIAIVQIAETKLNGSSYDNESYQEARTLLDEGLNSCTRWWANPLYGKWDPSRINSGFMLLEHSIDKAIRAIEQAGAAQELIRANGFIGLPYQLRDRMNELKVILAKYVPR